MILAMDLSLSGSALAVLEVVENRVRIVEIVFVNNKKNAKMPHGYRLNNIAIEVEYLIKKYNITETVREKGFSRFATATQTLFKVVGVTDLVLCQQGVNKDIEEIPPTSVKKAVGGTGKADKKDVEEGLRKYLIDSQKNYVFETDDCSDAVAVGITYLINNNLLTIQL